MPQILTVSQAQWDEWTAGMEARGRQRLSTWLTHSATHATRTESGVLLRRKDWDANGVSKLVALDGSESWTPN